MWIFVAWVSTHARCRTASAKANATSLCWAANDRERFTRPQTCCDVEAEYNRERMASSNEADRVGARSGSLLKKVGSTASPGRLPTGDARTRRPCYGFFNRLPDVSPGQRGTGYFFQFFRQTEKNDCAPLRVLLASAPSRNPQSVPRCRRERKDAVNANPCRVEQHRASLSATIVRRAHR